MKKFLPLMVVAVAVSLFTSCKKDYSCTCTTTDNGTVVSTSDFSIGKQTKSDAETACSAHASSTGGGSTVSISCKLK